MTLTKAMSSKFLLFAVSMLVGFGGPADAHPFEGHFVSGCDGPATSCLELWLGQDGAGIRGWHAAATRNAIKIEGGDYYERGKNAPVSVHGEVHDGFATITIVSTHTGDSITAILSAERDHLQWKASANDHPVLPAGAILHRK